MADKLENVNVEIGISRTYNLGGYSNTITISRKIIGNVNDLEKYKDDVDNIISNVEIKFGNSISLSRRQIKKLSREIFEDDGEVKIKKQE